MIEKDKGKIVCIDIETKRWVIDNNMLKGAEVLKDINPEAQIFSIRIGYDCVYGWGTKNKVD